MRLSLYLSGFILALLGLILLLRFFDVWGLLAPSNMDILNLVLALLGIGLGMPSTIQMAFGKPKIKLGVGNHDTDNETILTGNIFNYPHSNKFLKTLGVRTEPAEDVWANFKILEQGTRRQIYKPVMLPPIYTYAGPESQRAVIPASAIPGVFRIVVIDKDKKAVLAYDTEQELSPGIYIVIIEVGVGEDKYGLERNLEVMNTYPYGGWVP